MSRCRPHVVSIGLLPKFGRYRTGPRGSLLTSLHISTNVSPPHSSSTTKALLLPHFLRSKSTNDCAEMP